MAPGFGSSTDPKTGAGAAGGAGRPAAATGHQPCFQNQEVQFTHFLAIAFLLVPGAAGAGLRRTPDGIAAAGGGIANTTGPGVGAGAEAGARRL